MEYTTFEFTKFQGCAVLEAKITARLMRGIALRNCYRASGNSRYYHVRMGLGGTQWEFGRHLDRCHAVRFADMCIVYFWKYRPARRLGPLDCDVNLSVEQANRDLAEYPEVKALLDAWANSLIERGVIKPAPLPPVSAEYSYAGARVGIQKNAAALREAIFLAAEHNPNMGLHFNNAKDAMVVLDSYLNSIDRILTQ